jgi:hypothetical protein
MQKYLFYGSYTSEGYKGLLAEGGSVRIGVAKRTLQSVGGSPQAVYGFGLIGAWVYYIGRAATPREKVIGFFKAFAWPAFVVHALLEFLEKK